MLRILSPRVCTTFTRTGMLFNVKTMDERKDWLKKKKWYSNWENEMVHEIFAENMYPGREEIEGVARKTGRPFESVRGKFHNMRQNYSKVFVEKLVPPNSFTDEDLKILRDSFNENERPDESEKQRLALKVDRTMAVINNWFFFERQSKANPEFQQNKGKKFTESQIEKMEASFTENNYPEPEVIKSFAAEFEREYLSIRTWFQNRRIKYEKEHNVKLQQSSRYSNEDKQILQDEFEINPYPSAEKIKELADCLDRSPTAIRAQFSIMQAVKKGSKYNNNAHKKDNWLSTKWTAEDKKVLERIFEENKFSVVFSPNQRKFPEDVIMKTADELGVDKEQVLQWIYNERKKERKQLGNTRPPNQKFTVEQIAEMLEHFPNDFPRDKERYNYFAEKYDRTFEAIDRFFRRQKSGKQKQKFHSKEDEAKVQLERIRKTKETLNNHFKQDLFPSDADLRVIAEEVKMSLSRVKASLVNYRLVFEKKVGKEEFARRLEEGDFTACIVEDKPVKK